MNDLTELRRQTLARHLRKHIQGEVRCDATSRHLYSTDASIYQIEPLGVVIPRTVEDLVTVVQVAGEMGISITARGGGTSLSGQSIGPGIVVDCSKYLNALIDLDPVGRKARVQPGMVLDQLNRAVAPHNLQFGPEVATSSRANLGGMIGNNSAGARSIVYGKTVDHVQRLGVILADGSRSEFGPVSSDEWELLALRKGLEGNIYRNVRRILKTDADEIRRRFPQILRRVSGYNLVDLLTTDDTPVGLHKLVIGSEGTLAVITEAELNLIPKPNFRGLLVPHFSSLAAAMDALATCLEFGPSAVELLDQLLISMARDNLALKDHMAAVHGRPAALLMVEFSSDDAGEVTDRINRLEQRLAGGSGVEAVVRAEDPAIRDPLWSLRRAAMPLLYGMPGDRKPVTFVEDTAVAPPQLPEFVARFREVLQRHGTDGAFYGHASVGCLHIRPLLNLKDHGDVARMRQIMTEVTDLVLEYGGCLSGEHGDGLVRSEWNRKMFGPVVYEAFRQVKRAFDPQNLLNPGKVVDAPAMTENLRYGPDYHPAEPPTVFDYSKQEGFTRAIELCNGSGVCRKLQGGTMCPSFRATRDEKDSTRGRANALRLALAGEDEGVDPDSQRTGDRVREAVVEARGAVVPRRGPADRLRQRWVYDVLDLCLMCKACKSECPSNVDLAKLKAEFLQFYYAGKLRPLGHYLMAQIHRLNRWGAWAGPLINWAQEQPVLRWLLEQTAGFDRRRSLPPLHAHHFRRWFARHRPPAGAGRQGRVMLLDDCFNTYNEPEVGQAAVTVLERAGYAVELADLACCGRPMISKGFLKDSRDLIRRQAPKLARRLAGGSPLLGLEPSCLLTLTDEWPELLPGQDTKRIAAAAHLADTWIARQVQSGQCELPLKPRAEPCVLHGHCHQKALCGTGGSAAALRLIPSLDVKVLDTGCCGMAGSFGFETEHYDISVKVAELSLLPALSASPEALVAAPGTSCRHQIKDLAKRQARHPLEILAEQVDNT